MVPGSRVFFVLGSSTQRTTIMKQCPGQQFTWRCYVTWTLDPRDQLLSWKGADLPSQRPPFTMISHRPFVWLLRLCDRRARAAFAHTAMLTEAGYNWQSDDEFVQSVNTAFDGPSTIPYPHKS
nr:hypothetical protein CFP56_73962 [Quercus suber]